MTFPTSISKWRVIAGVAMVIVSATAATVASTLLEEIDREVTSVYEKSRDAIVRIHSQRQVQINGFSLAPAQQIGTGFFIDKSGHVLTADTVIDDTDSCWIEWRGQRVNAHVIGRDPQTNLALLKVDIDEGTPTPFLIQGNSDDVRVGSMVIAIGYPYDLPSTPVVGFVGGLDIQRNGHVFPTTQIRAGCRLSPGQGGGPLLDVHGQVIGVAVAARMDDQCYAVPMNAARKISSDILEYGQAQHPWVGLGVSERQLSINPAESNRWEVFVQQIYSNTPAASAGFRDGDVLVNITSNGVHRSADVLNVMFYHHAGDKVEFTILRNGQQQNLVLTVGNRPADEGFGTTFPTPPSTNPSRALGLWQPVVPATQARPLVRPQQ